MRGLEADSAALAERQRDGAAAVVIQGCQVFPRGQLPNYWHLTRRRSGEHRALSSRGRGPRPQSLPRGQAARWESRAAAALSHAASPSQSPLPAVLLSAQPLTQRGCETLVLSRAPFAPAFGGINDCAQHAKPWTSQLVFLHNRNTEENPMLSCRPSAQENPWYDYTRSYPCLPSPRTGCRRLC